MPISQVYELATDGQFRLLAGFTSPPRVGYITALEANGQVRVSMDDADGVDVLAWPLNGLRYAVGDLVYVAFASDSPESGIVVGSKGSVPVLPPLGEAVSVTKSEATVYEPATAAHTGLLSLDNPAHLAGASVGVNLKVESDAGALQRWWLGIISSNANYGRFAIKGRTGASTYAERLAILSTGDVGVGTDDPDGFEVDRAVTEVAQGRNNVRLGVRSGTPRMILEEATSGVQWQIDNYAGVFRYFTPGNQALILTTAGQIGSGTAVGTTPQGKLHLHDGVGGMIFVTKTGINSTTPRVLIPDATGDVARAISGFLVVSDGSLSTPASFALNVNDSMDILVGSVVLRLAVTSTGALQVHRQGGTGTGSVAILACWM